MFRPLVAHEAGDVAEFRAAVRSVVGRWKGRPAEAWEETGHLDGEIFAVLGGAGIFEWRWRHGHGGGARYAVALAEECADVSVAFALGVSLHSEVFCSVLEAGSSRKFGSLHRDALAGRVIGCVGSTEPEGGSDIAAVRTLAMSDGTGWSLSGTKWFTSNVTVATHAVVLARARPAGGAVGGGRAGPEGVPGSRGGPTLFVVPLDITGVVRLAPQATLGVRGCDTSGIRLAVTGLADGFRASPVGRGLLVLSRALQMERIAGACQILAVARRAHALAAAHLRAREQFGSRLVEKQALRHRMADVAVDLLAAECLLDTVVYEIESGRAMGHETAAVKLVATQASHRAVDEALQVAGGRGYLSAFPFERWLRDIRLARIGGGADEVMRELIAGELDGSDPDVDAELADLYDRSLFVERGEA